MGVGEARVTIFPASSGRPGYVVYMNQVLMGRRVTERAAQALARRIEAGLVKPRCSVCFAPADRPSELDASGRCNDCAP